MMRSTLLLIYLLSTISFLLAQEQTPIQKDSLFYYNEPDPNKFIPGAKQPKEINLSDIQKKIRFPALAREMNLEGTVVFRVLVDEDGCYVRHLPPKSGHPILIKAYEEYLHEIQFTPATVNGKPIKFWVNVPYMIHFQ